MPWDIRYKTQEFLSVCLSVCLAFFLYFFLKIFLLPRLLLKVTMVPAEHKKMAQYGAKQHKMHLFFQIIFEKNKFIAQNLPSVRMQIQTTYLKKKNVSIISFVWVPKLYVFWENYNGLKIHMRAKHKEAEYQALNMILEELTQASLMHLFAM